MAVKETVMLRDGQQGALLERLLNNPSVPVCKKISALMSMRMVDQFESIRRDFPELTGDAGDVANATISAAVSLICQFTIGAQNDPKLRQLLALQLGAKTMAGVLEASQSDIFNAAEEEGGE